MGKLVKAYWDCVYCGTKEIGGDLRECPNCSRPRGDVKFYMKDNLQNQRLNETQHASIEHVDEAKAATISRNPDWYCSFCDSLNTDNATNCKGCGASREDSEKNYFDIQREKEFKAASQLQPEPSYTDDSAHKKKRTFIILGILAAVIALLCFIFIPSTKDAKIVGLSWERSITVEQYQMFSESDWSLPSDAIYKSERTELHHYDEVLDHYETREVQRSREVIDHYDTEYTYSDLGNGYYEEVEHSVPVYRTEYYTETEEVPIYVSVPRYATKYYYDIWRWTPVRTEVVSGHDRDPEWPSLSLASDEREGTRRETYSADILIKKKTRTVTLDESVWNSFSNGKSIKVKSNRAGSMQLMDDNGRAICDLD